jgi:hypothetical protein
MPVIVEWFDESQKIVLYRVEGLWSLEEAIDAIERAKYLSQPAPTLFLSDLRQAKGLPSGILSKQDIITKSLNPAVGLTVMVGAHPLIRFFMNALIRLGVPLKNIVFVETMEQARELLVVYQQKENLLL